MRIITLLLSTALFVANASSTSNNDSGVEQKFEAWMTEFEREYSTEEEKEKRMKIWIDNDSKSIILEKEACFEVILCL